MASTAGFPQGRVGRDDHGPSIGLSIRTFLSHPTMVGSAFPASRWLVRSMLAPLDWQGMKLFVEFGPGTGVFTRAALVRLPADAILLALDTSPAFVDHLRASTDDQRLCAVCAPAADVAAIISELGLPPADCILSGLPFSTLSPADAEQTMRASRAVLAPNGMFCAYQMRRTIEPLLRAQIGPGRSAYEWRNIPPCHLYWAESARTGADCPDVRSQLRGAGGQRRPSMSEATRETLKPSDVSVDDSPRKGPLGDVRPDENDPDPRTRGGQPPEKVEDRPAVGTVKPEDYPEDERAKGA